MNDLIDRQTVTAKCFQAMKIISGEFGQELSQNDESYNTGLRKAIEIVRSLPPATPQPKVGQWIVKGESWYCTCCDEPICEIYDGKPYEKYCPNCGAKMEEVK